MRTPRQTVKARPAETTGGIGAVATLVVAIVGGSAEAVAAAGAIAGLLPAAVTLLVTNGGLRGVGRALWRGRG